MLSYQHLYHAGNNADCQKHAILCLLLQRLQEKEAAYCYKDIHSGRGLYDLTCDEALKTNEFANGLLRLWQKNEWPPELYLYRDLLKKLNPNGNLTTCPGSPSVAQYLMRPQDRLELYELHPQEFAALEKHFPDTTNFTDGWVALTDAPAPKENRGLVLIDPSYELKEDYDLMGERLLKAMQKWRNGIYAVWYPMLGAQRHRAMLDKIQESGLRKVLVSEIIFSDPHTTKGMYGSGMLIVNPPWKIEESIASVISWLVTQLGQSHRCEWLVEE